jgi:short-subunit dehydrogenase
MKTSLRVVLLAVLLAFYFNYAYLVFDPHSVKDLRVVITGASTGIGAELALSYCSLGARVVLVSRNTKKLEEITAQCKAKGANFASYVSYDFSRVQETELRQLVEDVTAMLDVSQPLFRAA